MSLSFLFLVKNERFSTPYSQTPDLKEKGCHNPGFVDQCAAAEDTSDTMLTVAELHNRFKMCSLRYTLHAILTCTLLHLIHLFKCFPLTHTLFCSSVTLI